MAYARRDFAGAAVQTTITSGISNADTSITIASATGWPTVSNGGFYAKLDAGTASEEKVLVTARTGTNLTVSRQVDGTSASSHSSGAAIYVCHAAVDDDEANYTTSQTVGKIAAQGDLLRGSAANTFAKLTKGTSGLPLVAGASDISYAQLTESGLAASVAGNGLGGANGSPLAVNVDASTITISADTLGVPAGGIGSTQLASAAVTAGKIAVGGISAANQHAAGVVDTNSLAANAVTAAKIANATITATQIANATITATQIAAATITQALIASGVRLVAVGTSAPGSPAAGDQWYDTTNKVLNIYNGSVWITVTPAGALVATSETTASTSFTDLTTSGPAVTVNTGTKAIVTVSCLHNNSGTNHSGMGFAVSGASTIAASGGSGTDMLIAQANQQVRAGVTVFLSGLTAGANTFTAKYLVNAGTGTFADRSITVTAIPT